MQREDCDVCLLRIVGVGEYRWIYQPRYFTGPRYMLICLECYKRREQESLLERQYK